jgi:hypothetical protein
VFGVRSSDVVIKVKKGKIEQLSNNLTFKFRKLMIPYKINIKGMGTKQWISIELVAF